jgi:exopolyphosphatase/guanosine-5'-triphosphate,3'-diphosphate pyrophosphatase
VDHDVGRFEEPTVAVLDAGSFSARLVVLSATGSPREPLLDHRIRLRLDRELDDHDRLSDRGIAALSAAVGAGMAKAAKHGVTDVYPLATSCIRDARNSTEVVRRVDRETGVELKFLSGRREAELAYLAARRWYGAAAGPLLVVDIGGGTVELAAGSGEHATFARSLRLGARSMTRDWLASEPVSRKGIQALREHVVDELGGLADDLPEIAGHRVVGCSKVVQQLARLAGDRPGNSRELRLSDLRAWIPRLAALPPSRRAKLPGISRVRAHQALAGAVVAEALLTSIHAGETDARVAICPWSTRDGLLLTLLDSCPRRGARRSHAA